MDLMEACEILASVHTRDGGKLLDNDGVAFEIVEHPLIIRSQEYRDAWAVIRHEFYRGDILIHDISLDSWSPIDGGD